MPESPLAIHDELKQYYIYIRDNPVTFTQYNNKALTLLAGRAADGLTPEAYNVCLNLAGPQSSQGWAGVYPGPFSFPDDHGPHCDFRNEWYYLAGNFNTAANDLPISIVFSSRRRGIIPPGKRKTDDPAKYDLWLEQLAVTIPAVGVHTNRLDYLLGETVIVETQARPFKWSVGDYKLYSAGDTMFPMRFEADTAEVEIVLELETNSDNDGFFLQGNEGCAPCINGLGYRYYSWPIIYSAGTLVDKAANKRYELVGTMWLDHQWGARMSPCGYLDSHCLRAYVAAKNQIAPSHTPWNWFFVHLVEDGKVVAAITTVKIPAEHVDKGCGPFPLSHTTFIGRDISHRSEVGTGTIACEGFIESPFDHAKYPHGWTLCWKNIDLKLTPTASDQFIGARHDIGIWEGGVVVRGTMDGKPVSGYGFAEMTACDTDDEYLRNSLEFLGIDRDAVDVFRPVAFTRSSRFSAVLYLSIVPLVILAVVLLICLLIKLT